MTVARANFLATIERLAQGEREATRVEDEGFTAWIAPGDPPMANFAQDLRLDPWAARRLADLARAQRRFRVYEVSGDSPEHAPEILQRAGFAPQSQARMMLASPGGEPGGASPEQEEDPREVAAFIADQFFARSNPVRRDAFARAVAAAPDTRLLSLRDRSGVVAAMMLSATEGALGIYNLCVAPRRRGAGIGTELVRWVLAHSATPVTLQCDARLEAWYRKFSFRVAGEVRFYGLASARESDTM